MNKFEKKKKLLPLEIIFNALNGDAEAIESVLEHFSGYIAELSLREYPNEYGLRRKYLSEDIRSEIEMHVWSAINSFDINY